MDKIRIALIGAGGISRKMAQTIEVVPDAELYAVSSRAIENAKAFAKEYSVPHAYTYDEAIADPNVDLCYIALPHVLHYEFSKKCLLAGKNVLCEKPLCINARQAEELFSIAKEKGVFFSEHMWARFLPEVKAVQKLIADGAIGDVKYMSAVTACNCLSSKDLTDPSKAGGMLLDCGIYVLTCVDLILGDNISDIETRAVLSKEGVDLHSTTTLHYPDGRAASLYISMDSCFANKITIAGEKGYIQFNSPFGWTNIGVYTGTDKLAYEVEMKERKSGGYEYILTAICDAIKNGKPYCEECPPEKTLYILRLMDTLREKWGLKYPME